jgi:uncharacterized damage-inducible protein DinB
MKPVRVLSLLVAAILGAGATMSGQQTAALSGFRADVLGNIDYAAKELISLAEAVPAEKYAWRPAPGVRSVSEVYMHVVLANYYIPSLIGVKLPEGIDRDMETKVTDKAKVVEALKKSIAHLHTAIEGTPDADLDTKVKLFGRDMSKRAVYILVAGHVHEHLGQSIAYARSNGITPPWSASEGEPAKKTGK